MKYCPFCRAELRYKKIGERERQVCPQCGWVYYRNPIPSSAAFVRNSLGEILLVKRAVEPGKGLWGLPSGFIEIDESPEQACIRELEEETGLKGKIMNLIGVYSQESEIYKNVIIIGYRVQAEGDLKPGSDSEEVEFFDPECLPEIAFSSHKAMISEVLKERSET